MTTPMESWTDFLEIEKLKDLRRDARMLLDTVFGEWEDTKGSKEKMNGWVSYRVKTGDIQTATKQELENIIKILRRTIKRTK